MRFRGFTLAGLAALMMFASAPATAAPACCDDCKHPCKMPCCAEQAMPCCAHGADKTAPAVDTIDGIELLFAMDVNAIVVQADETRDGRQTAVVWFHRPVWVGRNVLLGKYVIEHDTGRQARGEPCTYIYAADNRRTPVVTFHCTHIDGTHTDKDTVMLQTLPDGMQKLVQFQFAGEHAAHGYPVGR